MMKKYLCLWTVVMLTALQMHGQVSMTVQIPPVGIMQKSQLWNIVLTSASANPVSVKMVLRLSDAETNQPLLTGVSRTIVLNKGGRRLQATDIEPIQYEYLSAAVDRNTNGLLTTGNYQACYSVVSTSHTGGLIAEDCIPFTVEPVSPPLLNTPANESMLESRLPQFTWLPPAPLNIFNDLNYELKLVEVRPGQSAPEAIQQNIPVFRAPHNKNLFINYPASAMTLDTAKLYAWTIIANNGPRFAAQTEVWTFRIAGKQVNNRADLSGFVQLKKELTSAVINCSGPLQVSYSNLANDKKVQYEIIALQDNNEVVQTGSLSLQAGENLLELALKRSARLEKGKSYQFRLVNSRQERWSMKFIYAPLDKQ
ncbi:hypothetical protein F0L74_11800 [Chitinophaga agrisoli]|uniref:Oxygen tolerance protein BatD n=1 Tax=Chitinophaga agrisoli TaxID=2607653 RepID=A0A5B2VXZ3_9BACT|nr:hypothetical protein [Chitinophaga agrisoli]KAA2243192.1 hypothetical protein F0L74_11800 [Chitinophaga agrisoli]